MDAGLQQFAEKYNLSLQDPNIQEKYIHNRLAELDYQTNMNIYREEGMEKGIDEGMEKMLRIFINEKNIPIAQLKSMAHKAGFSETRFEQIYHEESD